LKFVVRRTDNKSARVRNINIWKLSISFICFVFCSIFQIIWNS